MMIIIIVEKYVGVCRYFGTRKIDLCIVNINTTLLNIIIIKHNSLKFSVKTNKLNTSSYYNTYKNKF